MHESERRQALADFLRKRRARLSPVDVGLPPGMRRRTPGLRREEVAQLANIGTSWYVWLEQGRNVHPSAQVLESLARALKLTLNERRHLFLLAGQPLPPNVSVLEEKVSPALQQVLDDLNPTPAYVMGRRWDYLAWNRAADGIFTLTDGPLPYGRNLLWRVFTNPLLRQRPDREQMLRGSLAEFRTALARYPGDEYFEELIEELKQVKEDLRPHFRFQRREQPPMNRRRRGARELLVDDRAHERAEMCLMGAAQARGPHLVEQARHDGVPSRKDARRLGVGHASRSWARDALGRGPPDRGAFAQGRQRHARHAQIHAPAPDRHALAA